MRDVAILSIVAILALLGLVFATSPAVGGAFVTRPMYRIVPVMSYDSIGADLCTGSRAYCDQPNCPTGLARVRMPGDITRYQWLVIPSSIGGQRLGGCCQDATQLTFQAQEMGTYHVMELTCSHGAWSAVLV